MSYSDRERMKPWQDEKGRLEQSLKVGDSKETLTIPWKNMAEANVAGKKLTLHYGPQRVELPFTVQLIDFHHQQ